MNTEKCWICGRDLSSTKAWMEEFRVPKRISPKGKICVSWCPDNLGCVAASKAYEVHVPWRKVIDFIEERIERGFISV